jgi:glycosyltransferase involved in cell wall biosynthesis
MQLSIIIPTKNEENYLPLLLKSLKKQTNNNFEILVADANSKDNTIRIAKKSGCKVVKGGYPDEGRNRGAEKASKKSKILIFLDADTDFKSKKFLENALKHMKENNFDIMGTIETPMKTGNLLNDLLYFVIFEVGNFFIKLSKNTKKPLMQNCIFVKKTVHKKVKFKPLVFGEDSVYAEESVEKGFKFGLYTKEKVLISPRRFENKGLLNHTWTFIYFNIARGLGIEFYRGKTNKKYFT